MIIFDGGQLALVPAFARWSACRNNPTADKSWVKNPDEIRKLIVNQLNAKIKMYKALVGTGIVVALDSRSWRRDAFKYYKANRDTAKAEAKEAIVNDETVFPFDDYFAAVNQAIKMLKAKYKTFHFIQEYGAEGDDGVAISAKWCFNRDPTERIVVISSDKDFAQLGPIIFKQVKYGPGEKLVDRSGFAGLEHIVKGDHGDGVPSITQPDDYLVNKAAYPDLVRTASAKIQNELSKLTESQRECHPAYGENYIRNRQLVMFDYIPEWLVTKIETGLDDKFGQRPYRELTTMEKLKAASAKAVVL